VNDLDLWYIITGVCKFVSAFYFIRSLFRREIDEAHMDMLYAIWFLVGAVVTLLLRGQHG